MSSAWGVRRGAAKSVRDCLISNESGVLVRARRDPHGDDEGVYSIPSPARSHRMSSSTTTASSRQPLAQVLRNLADPRDRRGVRHDLSTVLSLAVTGVLAGCRSLTAIWEHTTDLTVADLGPWAFRSDRLFRQSRPSGGCSRTWTPRASILM